MAIANDFFIDYKNKAIVHASNTFTYTSLSGTFVAGEVITASGGKSATIVTDNGSSSMTVTRVTGTFAASNVITGGYSGATATISTVPSITTLYTVRNLYTYLQDSLDGGATIDDTIPMSASTPTDFTLTNGWYIDEISTQFLQGGAITTSGWNGAIQILTFDSAGYSSPTNADIGKTVGYIGGSPSTTGTLLGYDTAARKWWVRGASTFSDLTTNIDIDDAGDYGDLSQSSTTGENLWSNIFTLGSLVSGTTLDVYQNDVQITPWWTSGQIDVLVKVMEASSEIDSGNITVLARKYTTLYDHFVIDASTGRNPVPLAAFTDSNNQTAEGTVSGYSDITITFGATSQNLGNGNGSRPYDVSINCAGRVLTQVYEYLKYVTRTGSGSTLNGVSGEFYVAVGDIRLDYTGESSGPFVEGSAITSSAGGSGYITSLIDNGTTGTLVIRNVHGTFADTNTITSGSTTATISGVPDSITPSKQAPFGTFAGGNFFGARGVYITNMHANDSNNYELIDSTNTAQVPPSTVAIVVEGLVSGDRVSVFRTTGSDLIIDREYLHSHATANSAATTAWETAAATPIPADTPSAGYVRLVKIVSGTYTEERKQYTSWTGNIFTLASAHSGGYDSSDRAYVPYIDEQASGTSISKSVTYVTDRTVSARVRVSGIIPFTTFGSLTSNGYTTTAIRTEDTIA
jgi:hypothetical protein